MKSVWVLALDGVMDSSLSITLDLLRTAQAVAAGRGGTPPFTVRVLGARGQVPTGAGLRLPTDARFRAPGEGRPHWAIVPALGQYGARLAAHLGEPDARQAIALLRELSAQRVRIGASCASVFLLAEAGLLAGRRATTTWWLASAFRARYQDVELDERRMVVRDGPLLTAGSAFAQLDLMLAVLGDLVGLRVAEQCARHLLIDRRPSQARYMMAAHAPQHDPLVAAAERWIDERVDGPMTVRALAQALGVSEKTLARKVQAATGLSPIKLIQRRRLMVATHLIESTRLPIEDVAERVGYRDSTTLRRLIRRELDTSPRGLR